MPDSKPGDSQAGGDKQPAAAPEDSSSPQAASDAAQQLMELAKLFGVKGVHQVIS